MAYSKTVWNNDTAPAINADNLNKIENELELLDTQSDKAIVSLNQGYSALLYDIFETITEHSGYLMNNGTFSSDANTHCKVSKMIPCKEGDIFYYKGVGQALAVSALFYNGGKIISNEKYNSANAYTQVTIPSGIDGVVFSSFATTNNSIVFDIIAPYHSIKKIDDNQVDYFNILAKGISSVIYEHNGFLQADGTFSSDANIYSLTTQKIPTNPGDIFYYKGVGQALAVSALFYNNDLIVGNVKYASATQLTEIIIPANTNYVVFSSFASGSVNNVILSVDSEYGNLLDLKDATPKGIIQTIDYNNIEYVTNFVVDKYIDGRNGNLADGDGSVVTNLIDLSGIIYIWSGGKTQYLAAGCVLYDENSNYIVTYITQGIWSAKIDVDELLKIYPNAKYIRFSSLYQSTYPLTVYIYRKGQFVQIPAVMSALTKKSYYALGDSFTHGDWNNDEEHPNWETDPSLYDASMRSYKTYVYWISQRNNMELHNLSGNGYQLIGGIVGQNIYKEVPADADYCTLMIGLNDAILNKPIGTIDSTDSTEFYGCLNILMNYYRENRPNLHFGILVLPNLKEEYRVALINASKKYGYPYMDFYNDPTIPAFMNVSGYPAKVGMDLDISDAVTEQNKVSADNWHPNLDAHKKMSHWVEKFIIGI